MAKNGRTLVAVLAVAVAIAALVVASQRPEVIEIEVERNIVCQSITRDDETFLLCDGVRVT